MKNQILKAACLISILSASRVQSVELIALGTVSGSYEDLATETAAPLENGVPGNRLGGFGSGLAYAGGTTFLAVPDRGPTTVAYNALIDDTTSYIARFHTFNLTLAPVPDAASGLPFTLTPMLTGTTLLSSPRPLVYSGGDGLGDQVDGLTPIGSGEPLLNDIDYTDYFTGRSDNFDPALPSTDPLDARLVRRASGSPTPATPSSFPTSTGLRSMNSIVRRENGSAPLICPPIWRSPISVRNPTSRSTSRITRSGASPIKAWKAWPLAPTAVSS